MKRMNKRKNNNLYYQGFFARLKEGFGKVFVFIGVMFCLFGWFLGYKIAIVGGILLAIGICLCLSGGAQKLNFQRRSGHVIYRGD